MDTQQTVAIKQPRKVSVERAFIACLITGVATFGFTVSKTGMTISPSITPASAQSPATTVVVKAGE